MSSPSDPAAAAPPRPTIFISYASEDRAAVRQLRDALEAAGLDVWYDENELSGGDSWDQKIRRQIRDCEYFMPVISAATEQRKEGYFRREWRLATDRSLDMADDVLFLVPVTIDNIPENGARVPDKFLSVQWLRLPGGQPTPALQHLVRRILSGDHHALTRPPMAFNRPAPAAAAPPPLTPPPAAARPAPAPETDAPMPPMPPFPHVPEKGGFFHGVKFAAEVLWWALTAARMLFLRAPKWVRVLITVWLVILLFSTRCSRSPDPAIVHLPTPPAVAAEKARTRHALRAAAERFAQAAKAGDAGDSPGQLAQFGTKLAREIAGGVKDADLTGKQLVAVPFALGVGDAGDAKFLGAVFTPLYGRLAIERAGETALAPDPLATPTDEALVGLGHRLAADFTLGAWVTHAGDHALLTVRLMKTEDATVAWTGQYPLPDSDPAAVSEQIATAVLAAVPKE